MQREGLFDVPVNEVIPYHNNPRINDAGVPKVKASLEQHGYVKVSIGVDEDMVMLYGHTTLKAIKELGWKTIPEVSMITGLSKEQKTSYRIADNKTAEYSTWDLAKLDAELASLPNLDATGFTKKELERLRKEIEPKNVAPPQVVETDILPGDIYSIGKHRIMCGDSTDINDVNKLYGDDIAALIVTSPPYNLGKEGWLGVNTSKYEDDTDNASQEKYYEFLCKFMDCNLPNCCYMFLNMQQVRGNKIAYSSLMYKYRFNLADTIIWNKETAQPAMTENVLNSQFEYINVFKESPANRKIGTKNFRGTLSNIYNAPAQHSNDYADLHAATFPLHLPSWIISNFSLKNEIIADPFLGTGTSLLAAHQLDRTGFGIELNPLYTEISVQRLEGLTGLKRTLL